MMLEAETLPWLGRNVPKKKKKEKEKPPTPAPPPRSQGCQANLVLQGAKGNMEIMGIILKRSFQKGAFHETNMKPPKNGDQSS